MSNRRTNLLVEELGSRTLASATVGALLGSNMQNAVVHTQSTPPVHLRGFGAGIYTLGDPIPDVGMSYGISGAVSTPGLGTFNVSGTLHGVGFLAQGHATGRLVLSNAQGTITLSLHGPLQSGFSAMPVNFAYSVANGTGAYQHLSRSGTAHFTFTADFAPPPAAPPGTAVPLFIVSGGGTLACGV